MDGLGSIGRMIGGISSVLPSKVSPTGFTFPNMLGGQNPRPGLQAAQFSPLSQRILAPTGTPRPGETFSKEHPPSSERSTNPILAHDRHLRPLRSPANSDIYYHVPTRYELVLTCHPSRPRGAEAPDFSILNESRRFDTPSDPDMEMPKSIPQEEGHFVVRDYGMDRLAVASLPTIAESLGIGLVEWNCASARAEWGEYLVGPNQYKQATGFLAYRTRTPRTIVYDQGFVLDGVMRDSRDSAKNPISTRIPMSIRRQGLSRTATIINTGMAECFDYTKGRGSQTTGARLFLVFKRHPVTGNTKFKFNSSHEPAQVPNFGSTGVTLPITENLTIYPVQVFVIAMPPGVKMPPFEFFTYEVADPDNPTNKATFYDGLIIPFGPIFFSGHDKRLVQNEYGPPVSAKEMTPVHDMAVIESYPRLNVQLQTVARYI